MGCALGVCVAVAVARKRLGAMHEAGRMGTQITTVSREDAWSHSQCGPGGLGLNHAHGHPPDAGLRT